jgi:hypothetical protein
VSRLNAIVSKHKTRRFLASSKFSKNPAGIHAAILNGNMITALILLGLVATGLTVGFLATATAPMGFQDESGFHFGPGRASKRKVRRHLSATHAELAGLRLKHFSIGK